MKGAILEPADTAEAEMAQAAHLCLITALDRSKAEKIEVTATLDLHADGDVPIPPLQLPPRALRFLAEVLRQMAKGEPMALVPHKHEMTTQDAANFLNVSRPFIIKEIEQGKLKCRKVNLHRRIEFQELLRYQAEQKGNSEKALQDLSDLTHDLGLDF